MITTELRREPTADKDHFLISKGRKGEFRSMSKLIFLRNPTLNSHYLIYTPRSYIACGGYPSIDTLRERGVDIYVCLLTKEEIEKYGDYRQQVPNDEVWYFPIKDGKCRNNEETMDIVLKIYKAFRSGKKIYIHCYLGEGRTTIIGVWLLCLHHSFSPEEALERWKFLCRTRKIRNKTTPSLETFIQLSQIKKFKRPLRVIVSGDRDSSIVFDDIIRLAFREFPKGTVIIQGGCKGIDLFAKKIAEEMGYETETYPVSKEEWEMYGNYAGPRRNKKMLKKGADLVLGFHPDISYSKGTKDMLTQAYRKNVKCYIHDLSRKERYVPDS